MWRRHACLLRKEGRSDTRDLEALYRLNVRLLYPFSARVQVTYVPHDVQSFTKSPGHVRPYEGWMREAMVSAKVT